MKELHYQRFGELGGRFVSEFGLHGFPDIRTIKVFAPEEKDRYPNSKIMDSHNKSHGAEYKLGKYLWSNFQMPTTIESFVYLSQLLQAEALDHALIPWRRDWRGENRELNAGALIWQVCIVERVLGRRVVSFDVANFCVAQRFESDDIVGLGGLLLPTKGMIPSHIRSVVANPE